MANPLLVIKKKDDGTSSFFAVMDKLGVKTKVKVGKISFKADVKPAKKTKKKKEKKPEPPPRKSPFKVGDAVWFNTDSSDHRRPWKKAIIVTAKAPGKTTGFGQWHYTLKGGGVAADMPFDEGALLPATMFTQVPADVETMNIVSFSKDLCKEFDHPKGVILEARQKSTKKPWGYYVIPDISLITELLNVKGKDKQNDWVYNQNVNRYKGLASEVPYKLIPISSSAKELLTYLGMHIFSGEWKKTNG